MDNRSIIHHVSNSANYTGYEHMYKSGCNVIDGIKSSYISLVPYRNIILHSPQTCFNDNNTTVTEQNANNVDSGVTMTLCSSPTLDNIFSGQMRA